MPPLREEPFREKTYLIPHFWLFKNAQDQGWTEGLHRQHLQNIDLARTELIKERKKERAQIRAKAIIDRLI
jgi:hypothetical protein